MSGTIKTGRIDRGKYHEYWIDGIKQPGITTMLNSGLPRPALIAWAANVTSEYATDHIRELARMAPSQRLNTLKNARYSSSDEAKVKGTAIHKLSEQMNRGEDTGTIPAGLEGYIASMRAFLSDWRVTPVFTELPIFNREFGFGGTADLIASCNDRDELWCFDLKTGKNVYGESAYQTLMYSLPSNFYLNEETGAEVPIPRISRLGVVHLTPTGYSVWEVRQDIDREAMLDEFLAIKKVSEAAKNCEGYLEEIEKVAV